MSDSAENVERVKARLAALRSGGMGQDATPTPMLPAPPTPDLLSMILPAPTFPWWPWWVWASVSVTGLVVLPMSPINYRTWDWLGREGNKAKLAAMRGEIEDQMRRKSSDLR